MKRCQFAGPAAGPGPHLSNACQFLGQAGGPTPRLRLYGAQAAVVNSKRKEQSASAHVDADRDDRMSVVDGTMAPPVNYVSYRSDAVAAFQQLGHAVASTSAVHVPPCTRQSMQDDAACYAVSENQLFSLANLIGLLAMGAEPIR